MLFYRAIRTYGSSVVFMLIFRYRQGPFRVGSSKGSGESGEAWNFFATAQLAFADPFRVIAEDLSHSTVEKWFYCFGLVEGGVLTVQFTYRSHVIRIFGAGYWRKGRQLYERECQIHE